MSLLNYRYTTDALKSFQISKYVEYSQQTQLPDMYWTLCSQITRRSWVLLMKLSVPQLVKKFPAFYGTRTFITAFTSTCQLSLSWARSIQSMPTPLHEDPFSHYLSIHAYVFQPISFPQVFPSKPCTYFSSTPIRATCSTHFLLEFITLIITHLIISLITLYSGFQNWCNITNPQASIFRILFSSLHKRKSDFIICVIKW